MKKKRNHKAIPVPAQQAMPESPAAIQQKLIRSMSPENPADIQRRAIAAGKPPSPAAQQRRLIARSMSGKPMDMPIPEGAPPTPPQEAPAPEIMFQPAAQEVIPVPRPEPRMTRLRLAEAVKTLMEYRAGKAHLESRLVEVEQWWKMRHWEWMQEKGAPGDMKTASAWLFNVIVSKHADSVISVPEANVLPREEQDKATAKVLSSIIPCVLSQNHFDRLYSDVLWQKLKCGTGAYGVFWDRRAHNGIGDIAIRKVNLLNLFWEPGINDIQESRNVFHVEMVDSNLLVQQYPHIPRSSLKSNMVPLRRFITEDPVDRSDKSAVIDWYYHTWENDRPILHYCKFVGETVLYATEDDPSLNGGGVYDHGRYPFILDPLFPVEGSPCGFGYIDVCKNAQEQIDILNQAIIKNSLCNATPRYFIRSDGSINEKEFLDFTKPIVHVTGNLGADSLAPIANPSLDAACIAVVNNKIAELKETSGNTDSSNGVTQAGAQAASAIAALQEASGKVSRAASLSAYRAFCLLVDQIIELIRQFYTMPRQFRITGDLGKDTFITFENTFMQPQPMDFGLRLPVFDVKVSAQTRSAYSKNSRNELALALYNQGIFNPNMRDQAMALLDMMDFDGKDLVMQKVSENGSLMQDMARYQQIALSLAQKYEPETAQQLSAAIMGAARAANEKPKNGIMFVQDGGLGGNITKLSNARQRAREAPMPVT